MSTAIPDDISIFDQSSPESLKARALSPHLHDHLNSTSDEQISNTDIEYDFPTYKQSKVVSSSRSSISSFPGSVIHTIPFTDTEDVGPRTPSRSQSYDRTLKAPGPGYLSAFRNPSSVRALQLESEWADSDASSLRYSRRSPKAPRVGSRSPGSAHSSPAKRLSRPATPRAQSSKLKKEFPLVLLHCSLLPPAATAYGPLVADEILQAVLPEQYRKRWKTLQDKVVKNNEVKQRGVLIPHPREDYELLEELLLESLELERPRIRRGHFLGPRKSGDSDSGFESSSQNGTDEASDTEDKHDLENHHRCSDCGIAVSRKVEQDHHWEIKVYAANGLMKGPAWAAAWEEMEKVDVEVGIWMPEGVRTEVEERLKALKAMEEAERPVDPSVERKTRGKRARSNTAKIRHDERMREIYGERTEEPTQEEIDGLTDPVQIQSETQPKPPVSPAMPTVSPQTKTGSPDLRQEDFISFMKRNARIICQDQRNLAIVLLSVLVLLFSFQNANSNVANTQHSDASTSNSTLQHPMPSMVTTSSVSYITQTVYETPIVSSSSEAVLPTAAYSQQNDTIEDIGITTSVEAITQTWSIPTTQETTAPSQAMSLTIWSSLLPTLNTEIERTTTDVPQAEPDRICTNVQHAVLDDLLPLEPCTCVGGRAADDGSSQY